MALIVEDGSIVANANSFATDAEFVAYASSRGITLPVTEDERDQLQLRAVDYITSLEHLMQGVRVSRSQPLPFPRAGVILNGYYLHSNEIPTELKNAQFEAAIAFIDMDLLVNEQTQNIKKEQLGNMVVEYTDKGKTSKFKARKVMAYLGKLLNDVNMLLRS